MAESTDAPLRLRPFVADDRPLLQRLFEQAHLHRRTLPSGLNELHPCGWSPRRHTFVALRGHQLLGTAELLRDDDDETAYELSVTLEGHAQPGDGARCAAAALFYAFEALDAEAVWFWVPRGHKAVERFAQALAFQRLHSVRMPDGSPADVFELSAEAWQARGDALTRLPGGPVELRDHVRAWHNEGADFARI